MNLRLKAALPLAVLTLSLLPLLLPYLKPGFQFGHDRAKPFMYVDSIQASLQRGEIPPRWFPDFDGGYGSPYPSYYAMLFFYSSAAINGLGLSLGASVEALAFLVILLSAWSMYLFARALWGTLPGLLAALLYAYAPFHLVDAFVRGAYSELAAFVWFPVLLHHLYRGMLTRKVQHLILGGLAVAGLLLTHNLMAFLFLPLGAAVALLGAAPELARRPLRIRTLLQGSMPFWIGFGLSAYFWLPIALESRYVHIDEFLYYAYSGDFVPVRALFLPARGHTLTTELGLVHAFSAGLGFLAIQLLGGGERHRWLHLAATAALALCLFMTTRFSAWIWGVVPLLDYVQFPWRFLAPATFFVSLVAAPAPLLFRTRAASIGSVAVLAVGALVLHRGLIGLPHRLSHQEVESLQTCREVWLTQDFRPRWSQLAFWRGPNPPETQLGEPTLEPCQGQVQGEGGEVAFERIEVRGTVWEIDYRLEAEGPSLILPQFYYPGWTASSDGEPVPVEPRPGDGLLKVPLQAGEHTLTAWYENTLVRTIGNTVSVITLLIVVTGSALELYPSRSLRRSRIDSGSEP